MGKKKKVSYETLTIKQANYKNAAEEAHLGVVKKFLASERARRLDDIDKARKAVRKSMQAIRNTQSVSGNVLELHQMRAQNEGNKDVTMHILNCYLLRQEKNKEKWLSRQFGKQRAHKAPLGKSVVKYVGPLGDVNYLKRDFDYLPAERPVTTPDHMRFIEKRFPQTHTLLVDDGWAYKQGEKKDIYGASHDMMCMSTRAKPAGGYKIRCPVNFRNWKAPSPEPLPGPMGYTPMVPNDAQMIIDRRQSYRRRTIVNGIEEDEAPPAKPRFKSTLGSIDEDNFNDVGLSGITQAAVAIDKWKKVKDIEVPTVIAIEGPTVMKRRRN